MVERKRIRDMLERKRTQRQKMPLQGTLTKELLQKSSMGSRLGRIQRYLKRLRQQRILSLTSNLNPLLNKTWCFQNPLWTLPLLYRPLENEN